MSAPTASTRLLSTFELLEDIILYLPLRQILLSQRVGRAFANVITGSKPIQRALFLAPHDDETIKYYPKPGTFEHEWKVAKDGEPLTPVVNPFLPRALTWTARHKARAFFIHNPQGDIESFTCHTNLEHGLSESKAKMILTHPPARTMQLSEEFRISSRSCKMYTRNAYVENEAGVRFGDLLQQASSIDGPRRLAKFKMQGAALWRTMPDTVNVLTGHDMVRLLHMSNAQLLQKIAQEARVLREDSFGWWS